MLAAARTQKERCRTRPPEQIPHLKLDMYVFLVISSGTPKIKEPYSNPHARTRALPKREVLRAAAGANSLFKTRYLSFPLNFERNPKNKRSLFKSACADPRGPKKRGVESGRRSEFPIQNLISSRAFSSLTARPRRATRFPLSYR